MSYKYLDLTGLSHFWDKIKAKIPTKTSQLTNDSGYTTNVGTITGIKMNGASKGTSGVVDLGTVITAHQSLADRAVNKTLTNENLNNVTTPGFYNAGGGNSVTNKPSGVDHFGLYVVHGASGSYYTQRIFNDTTQYRRKCVNGTWGNWLEDKLTDTTYSNKTAASGGTDVSLVTTGEKYTWNNKTSNTGTVTSVAVKMNNTTKGTITTSGTIDLGTVITAHQDISGKQDKLSTQTAYSSKGSATKVPQITTNNLGQVTGITEVTITQPTVNNGTLNIQKNGTNVGTFTANQSGNSTANLTFSRNELSNVSSKEYSGIYGSANDQANASFYYGTVRPDNFYKTWRIKFRVHSNVPNQNEYNQFSEVEYFGNKTDLSYVIFNRMANTSGRCYYFHNVARLNATGYNANYSHILGMGLRTSNNPTSSSYPRYFKIDILETENCTFTFYDTMKKIANISEYSTTNYAGITEYDGCNNGLRESGDDNDISNLRIENGSIIAGANGVKQNSLCAMDSTGKYQSFTTTDGTGTSKTVNTSAKFRNPMIIFKNNSGTNYANNAEVGTGYQSYYASPSVDLRYSCNNSANFAKNTPTYLECTKDSDGYFSVTSNIILQNGFTSGRYYIHLGNTRRDQIYLMDLQTDHPIFYYDGSKLINENELKANKTSIPTKTSQLTNDSNFSYSIEKSSGTIDDLAAFTSGKPGITGSISLTKKDSGVGSEIPAGWYNFFFSPHRTGSGGDNINYGTIILTPMTFSGKSWLLRRSSSATTISEVKSIATGDIPTKVSQLTNDSGYTTNTGTVTSVAVKMNNTTKGTVTTSGTIDLGTVITAHQDISGKENTSNKVTSISSSSTNTQYPSALAVYNYINSLNGNGVSY